MVKVKAIKSFSIDGNAFDEGQIFDCDEERAFILQNRDCVRMVEGSEKAMFGTGIAVGTKAGDDELAETLDAAAVEVVKTGKGKK